MLGGKKKKKRKGVIVQTIYDALPEMLHDLKNGKEKGSSTHIPNLDKCWTWRKGEANIWSGYSNEGKSIKLRILSLIKILEDDWHFAFNAPEDYPAKEFFDDMVHTLTGFPTDRDHPMCVTEELYLQAVDLISDNIHFVYIEPPENTVKDALDEFEELIQMYDIDAVILDPLLKFSRPEMYMSRDDLYAQYIGALCMNFSRKHNVSLNLVMHQLTPEFDKDGFYVKPSMYRIKGGGSWADGFDNILSTQRPKYAKDKIDPTVIFSSQKIKKQKLVGIPQEFMMKFDRKTNRYTDFNTNKDLYNFDKWFK